MPSITTRSIMERLAPEMILHIFSFMPLTEIYRIRSVSKVWQVMAEEFIFMTIRSQQRKVYLRIGDKSRKVSIELIPHSYDPVNRIVEFRPQPNANPVPMMVDASNPWSTCHRRMQIHFSQWMPNNGTSSSLVSSPSFSASTSGGLSPQDQALMLFHMHYNPAVERMYELPPWSKTMSDDMSSARRVGGYQHQQQQFVGDKSLIFALSYVQQPDENHSSSLASPYGYPAVPISLHHQTPSMKPHWLRVTLGWIMSGLEPEIVPTQIYPQHYAQLNHTLARHGIFKYDPLSEPILSHIVHLQDDQLTLPSLQVTSNTSAPATKTQQQSMSHQFPTVHDMHYFYDTASDGENNNHLVTMDEVTPELLDYVQCHTHECHTRLSRLQHMLEGAGVDARVLWKYTFAKSYVVGNGSLLGEEDVVRRIQDSEEEWRFKRVSLLRRIGLEA
ncbi:hypothetical protein BDA99DRAFT_519332 [Phascolomyces articulosus]|uniref:F-box domain-containing protein n=1 Tax=Phascolomyces articulosus TaxID=60185 RepID=A0AAD5JU59_9FUNG|nr:hypothetical protein BDA99DRAFT_519332 [Phascolomyces articulosus]